ncbi:hypothetical protein AAY473_012507 [Plecturocebus cupreus]
MVYMCRVIIAAFKSSGGRRQDFILLRRLKCSSMIIAHYSLDLLDSKTESCYVAQAGLQLSNPPASVSQSAGITDCLLLLLSRLERNGTICHRSLCLLSSSDSPAQPPENAVSPCLPTGLELLTSGDLPASASQSDEITDVSHYAQPKFFTS